MHQRHAFPPPATRSAAAARPQRRPRPFGRMQRGLTLFGLMFWAIAVGFVAYLLIITVPTVNEYLTIQRTVDQIAKSGPSTVAEVRQAFDKQRDIEYAIKEVSGKDLAVTKENDKVVIGFAYDKVVPIYGNVFLLIKYEGRSR